MTPKLRLVTPLLGWPLTEHRTRAKLCYSCSDSALNLTYWDRRRWGHSLSASYQQVLRIWTKSWPLAYNPAIHSPTHRSIPPPVPDAFRPKWLVSAWHSPAWECAALLSRQFKPSRPDHLAISQHLHCRKVSRPRHQRLDSLPRRTLCVWEYPKSGQPMPRSRSRDASRDWPSWALCLLAEFLAVGCSVGVSVVDDATIESTQFP